MAFLFDDLHGPVEYFELVGSLSTTFQGNETVVRRDFLCAWDKRWVFARKMLGYHYIDEEGTGTDAKRFVRRVVPQSYAPLGVEDSTYTQEPFKLMFCSALENMEGVKPVEWNANDREGTNLKAKLSFTYRYPTHAVRSDDAVRQLLNANPDPVNGSLITDVQRYTDLLVSRSRTYPVDGSTVDDAYLATRPCWPLRYVSKTVQPSAQHLILPQGRMRFVDGTTTAITGAPGKYYHGTPATNITAKLLSRTELVYTWHAVPTSDITGGSQVKKAQRFSGCVNRHLFDDYPAGTLLVTAINNKPYRQLGGHYTTDLEVRMTYFEVDEVYAAPGGAGWIPDANGDRALGHNYLLRFTPEPIFKRLEAGTATADEVAQWLSLGYRYDLITHDGRSDGRRLFEDRDYYELFRID